MLDIVKNTSMIQTSMKKSTNNQAFGDDETNIVVIEFWAKFNEANERFLIGIKLRELSITELM